MASNSEISLQAAVSAVERAFAKLDAAADVSLHERADGALVVAPDTSPGFGSSNDAGAIRGAYDATNAIATQCAVAIQ